MRDGNEIIFREVQRFSLWLRLPFAVSIPVLICIAVFGQELTGLRRDSSELIWLIRSAIALALLAVAFSILLLLFKLETQVRSDGLYVRFFPIHPDFRKFEPESLDGYYECAYRPIVEYRGWGVRFGKAGKAYSMKGNRGVQLIFKSGERLLIGTQEPQQLVTAISSIMEKD
jgi:hypothetical protein